MGARSFPATLEQLEAAQAALTAALPEEWMLLGLKIELALEELWVNIVNHAYAPGQAGRIEVEGQKAEGEGRAGFLIRLRDWGPPFDPFTDGPPPDLTADVSSRAIGGLGIYLTKTLAQHCGYRREGESNLVELFFDPEA